MLENVVGDLKKVKEITLFGKRDGSHYHILTDMLFPDDIKIEGERYSYLKIRTRLDFNKHFCETVVIGDDKQGNPTEIYPTERRPADEALKLHIDTLEKLKKLYSIK